MRPSPLLPILGELARKGEPQTFHRVLSWLEAALQRGDDVALNALHTDIALTGDRDVANAFDACLDLICAEGSDELNQPITSANSSRSMWRCVALNMLIVQPSGVDLQRWADTSDLQATLATVLGLPDEDVYVDRHFLKTADAFDFGPLQAHRQCQLVKSRAAGVQLSFLDQLLAAPTLPAAADLCLNEAVVLVALKTPEGDLMEMVEELRELAHAEYTVDLRVPGARIAAQFLDVAAPWSGFTQFLHEVHAVRFVEKLQQTARDQACDLSELRLLSTLVESVTEDTFGVRTSFLSEDGTLLGGVAEFRVHEPEVYLHKVNERLSELGLDPVDRSPAPYLDIEVDLATGPRFLCNQGWQLLPEGMQP